MSKPIVYIGSSNNGLDVAEALGSLLEHEADTLIWSAGVFAPGEFSLESLLRSLDK
jgi:predicted nucleotide-binding protein